MGHTSLIKPTKRGASANRMTQSQYVFVLEFIKNDGDPCAAAKVAYPKSKNPSQQGARCLGNPAVKAYLGKVLHEKLEAAGLEAERILKQLEVALFLDPLDLFESSGSGIYRVKSLEDVPQEVRRCITKIRSRTQEDKDGEVTCYVEIELMSKDKALELAMKYRNLLEPDKNVTNVNVGPRIDLDALCGPRQEFDIVEGRILGRDKEDRDAGPKTEG